MEETVEVRRVLERSDKIKYIIIPKKSNFNKGDLVIVKKLNTEENNGRTEETSREPIRVSTDTDRTSNSNPVSRWKSIRHLRSSSGDTELVTSN